MNKSFGNTLTALAGLVVVAWAGFEIARRRHKLRELFDVLDKGDRDLTLKLEELVQQDKVKPL